MRHNYRAYVGLPYQGQHGCFALVRAVYEGAYGIDLAGLDAALADDPDARTARLHTMLASHCVEITEPREGDLVLIRSAPWHIAVVIDPPDMLHSYLGGASVVESYRDWKWRNRVEGFYRYVSR